jgi:ubiquinone/menaquinone biosynthesis C-methylase UbiE
LEIGIGTGANLQHLPPDLELTAVDESKDMLAFASRRAIVLRRRVDLGQADTEALPFPSGHFDTVVTSLVLCSVVDQAKAVTELHRVVRKPGGRLLMLEHMRPDQGVASWLVDVANVPWYAFNGRCHLNRRTRSAIEEAGFRVSQEVTRLGGAVRLLVAYAG